MRILIYVSGILGVLLLILRVVGIYLEYPFNDLLLYSGLVLLVLIFIPLYAIDRYLRTRKINRLIQAYIDQEKKEGPVAEGKTSAKGWGMNNSPFRERKSGLTWSGGNVHAANASRGTRRTFLKKS